MKSLANNEFYKQLFADVKQKTQHAKVKAVVAVNQELLLLYWEIGKLIVERQTKEGWGANVINQLSADLKKTFPTMKGFSPRNLGYMKRFAKTYRDFLNLQVPLAQISWYHNVTLLQKCPDEKIRFWYAQQALENGWSRDVMVQLSADIKQRI